MSDLEQTHWDDGHDSLLDGCPWCEIERLKEELSNESSLRCEETQRLRGELQAYQDSSAYIECELNARIEKLEGMWQETVHIFTDEQINAAWKYTMDGSSAMSSRARTVLEELGIVRCECEGNAHLGCNGHGWVIKCA